jgi:hypothetical protein
VGQSATAPGYGTRRRRRPYDGGPVQPAAFG